MITDFILLALVDKLQRVYLPSLIIAARACRHSNNCLSYNYFQMFGAKIYIETHKIKIEKRLFLRFLNISIQTEKYTVKQRVNKFILYIFAAYVGAESITSA